MQQHFVGLRAIREKIQPTPALAQQEADRLEAEIADLKRCLAGDSTSDRWKLLKIELTNKEDELLHRKRRLAGRNPNMESWADPLPG
jgi:hypothetical protein